MRSNLTPMVSHVLCRKGISLRMVKKTRKRWIVSKDDVMELRGTVTEALANAMFRVKLENDLQIICHISGRLRKNNIRILLGDGVSVEVSPYDLTKGRITYRHG